MRLRYHARYIVITVHATSTDAYLGTMATASRRLPEISTAQFTDWYVCIRVTAIVLVSEMTFTSRDANASTPFLLSNSLHFNPSPSWRFATYGRQLLACASYVTGFRWESMQRQITKRFVCLLGPFHGVPSVTRCSCRCRGHRTPPAL